MFTTRNVIAKIVSFIMLMVPWQSVSAAESISDSELARLYGGCPFYNPYCGVYGKSCPDFVEPDCEPFDLCRFCVITIGQKCFDYWAWWPDLNGCDNNTKACMNMIWVPGKTPWGYCGVNDCNENYDPTQKYPECSSHEYNWCYD